MFARATVAGGNRIWHRHRRDHLTLDGLNRSESRFCRQRAKVLGIVNLKNRTDREIEQQRNRKLRRFLGNPGSIFKLPDDAEERTWIVVNSRDENGDYLLDDRVIFFDSATGSIHVVPFNQLYELLGDDDISITMNPTPPTAETQAQAETVYRAVKNKIDAVKRNFTPTGQETLDVALLREISSRQLSELRPPSTLATRKTLTRGRAWLWWLKSDTAIDVVTRLMIASRSIEVPQLVAAVFSQEAHRRFVADHDDDPRVVDENISAALVGALAIAIFDVVWLFFFPPEGSVPLFKSLGWQAVIWISILVMPHFFCESFSNSQAFVSCEEFRR